MSKLEREFEAQLSIAQVKVPVREHRFAPPRRWRLDFAWLDEMIAAEIEGGTWSGGRHTRGSGFERDCEKYNTATLLGWRVFRFTADMVRVGSAVQTVEEALGQFAEKRGSQVSH